MIGIYIETPFFFYKCRNSFSIYDTEEYPSIFGCYSFCLSLMGLYDADTYKGSRIGLSVISKGEKNNVIFKAHPCQSSGKTRPKRKYFLGGHLNDSFYRMIIWVDHKKMEENIKNFVKNGNDKRNGVLYIGASESFLNDLKIIENEKDLDCINKWDSNEFFNIVKNKKGNISTAIHFNGKSRERYKGTKKWSNETGEKVIVNKIKFPVSEDLFSIEDKFDKEDEFSFIIDE